MPLSRRRTKLLKRLAVNKTRAREGLVLVEGVRAAAEALDAGGSVSFALVAPRVDTSEEGRALVERLRSDRTTDLLEVTDEEMATVADTEHPQGVVVVCEEPELDLAGGLARSRRSSRMRSPSAGDPDRAPGGPASHGPRVLLLDAVQDPGNVGTLTRSAVAFSFDLVVALDGTTDPWGSKAVRAAAGTVFRIPVVRAGAEETLEVLNVEGLPILVASAEGSAAVTPPTGGFALVLGNEGSGVRGVVRHAARDVVAVPMTGPAESLNVGIAGSILMSDFTKADRQAR